MNINNRNLKDHKLNYTVSSAKRFLRLKQILQPYLHRKCQFILATILKEPFHLQKMLHALFPEKRSSKTFSVSHMIVCVVISLTGSALYWTLWVLPLDHIMQAFIHWDFYKRSRPRGGPTWMARISPYKRRPRLLTVILFSSASRSEQPEQ